MTCSRLHCCGLKGVEDLGNGLKVGFKLENGFNSDDGTLGNGGRLFGREASLSVYTDYGTVSMGRMGGVGSSAGTYDLVYGIADAFDGGGDNNILGLSISDRYDNMITYQSPKFAGVQLTMQHSFNAEGTEAAQSSKNNRYSSAAVTGEFGANYDCGFAKTFAMAQYFKGSDTVIGGMRYEDVKHGDDVVSNSISQGATGYGLSVRYGYSLSKRTTVYTGAGYAKTTFKEDGDKEKEQLAQVYMGLTHTF